MLPRSQESKDEIEIPKHLTCPVTLLIFLEPVTVLPSGHVYEKEIIQALLLEGSKQKKEVVCPISRTPITGYINAWNILSGVDEYLQQNPNSKNQLYVREKPEHAYVNIIEVKQEAESNQVNSDLNLAIELQRQEQANYEQQRIANEQQQRELQAERDRLIKIEIDRQRQAEREKQSQEAFRQRQLMEQNKQKIVKLGTNLSFSQIKIRDTLINDAQNLIYALGFETGPKPKGRIDNFALLFFAIIEQALLEPLPWQKIKVHPGPKPRAMYEILKACIRALKEGNIEILENAKIQYAGQYELVKTWFGGEKSLENSGYASFARTMGTVSGQPGDHIYQLLAKVEPFLVEISPEHENHNKLKI